MNDYNKESLLQLRAQMKQKLDLWIPNNSSLVKKEMNIFDKVLSRRDFLVGASFATLSATINGYSSDDFSGPPSTWNDPIVADELSANPTLLPTEEEKALLSDIHNIIAHADLMNVLQTHKDIDVQLNSVVEGFNTAPMLLDSVNTTENTGFNTYKKNFGHPEIVHLHTNHEHNSFDLVIYEESQKGGHGATEYLIASTSKDSGYGDNTNAIVNSNYTSAYDTVVGANSSYHNTVVDGQVINQKMIAVANVGNIHNDEWKLQYPTDGTQHPFMLFYKNSRAKLQVAGTSFEDSEDSSWSSIDIFSEFSKYIEKDMNSLLKDNVTLKEIKNYHDGMGNSFIYGTLSVEGIYSFGFVANYIKATDTKPNLSFFIPKEYDPKDGANTFMKLLLQEGSHKTCKFLGYDCTTDFIHFVTNEELKKMAICLGQLYRPLSVQMDSDGNPTSNIIFTYLTYNFTYPQPDLDDFYKVNNQSSARLLFNVQSDLTGISYVANNTIPTISSTQTTSGHLSEIHFNYPELNTSQPTSIPPKTTSTFDIFWLTCQWQTTQLDNMYVRDFTTDGSKVTITTATAGYNKTSDLEDGDVFIAQHKIIFDINADSNSFTNPQILDAITKFSSTNYKTLWSDNFPSLAKGLCNIEFDFYCTLNHQGLLRSYFLFKPTTSSINNILLTFNEQGTKIEGEAYLTSTVDYKLWNEGDNDIAFMPPMPISFGVDELLPWYHCLHDGEVLFSSLRHTSVDSNTKELTYDGDGSTKSYYYNIANNIDGNWQQHPIVSMHKESEIFDSQVITQLHQVELQTINAYNNPIYNTDYSVEIRLASQGYVVDLTNPSSPKSYKVNRVHGCYLQPNAQGELHLELHIGHLEDKHNGTSIFYRAIKTSDINVDVTEINVPQITISSDKSIQGFKHFNVSYQVHKRMNSDNFDKKQPYAPESSSTPDSILNNVNPSKPVESKDVTLIKNSYSKVYNAGVVDNNTPLSSKQIELGDTFPTNNNVFTYSQTLEVSSSSTDISLGWSWEGVGEDWLKFCFHNCLKISSIILKAVTPPFLSQLESMIPDIVDFIEKSKTAQEILSGVFVVLNVASGGLLKDAGKLFMYAANKVMCALFNTKDSFKIGENIKELILRISNPDYSLYQNMQKSETQMKEKINNFFSDMENSVNGAIDDGLSAITGGDYINKSNTDAIKKQQKNTDKTKTNYVTNQVSRQLAKKPDYTPTSPYPTVGQRVETMESKIGTDIETTISNVSSDLGNAFSDLANSTKSFADVEVDLGLGLKSLIDGTLEVINDVADDIVEIPTLMLEEVYSSQSQPSTNQVEISILDFLSNLLLPNGDKFKNLDDLGYFILGFSMTIADEFIGELKSLIGISNSDDINTALLSPNFVANASAYLGIKSANSEDILMEDIKIAPISQVLDGLLSIANLITISMFTVNNVTNDEIPSEIVAPLFVAKFVVVLIQVSRLDCENTKISDMIALGIVTAGVIVSVFIIFTKNPNTKKIITTIGLSITIAGRVAQSYLSIVKYHCNSETEMDTVLELGIAYPIIGIVQSIAAVVAIWLPADGPIKAGSLAVVWIAWFARFEVLGYKDDELERLSNLSATKFCYL